MVTGFVQVPFRLVPPVRPRFPLDMEYFPEGLTNTTLTSATPDKLSVACAIRLTTAELVVVFTDIGLKVKPVNTGGVASCCDVT